MEQALWAIGCAILFATGLKDEPMNGLGMLCAGLCVAGGFFGFIACIVWRVFS